MNTLNRGYKVMKKKEYQELFVDLILLSTDCIRTSGDSDETERIPFIDGASSGASFVE